VATAPPAPTRPTPRTCAEHIPEGKQRPEIVERFPTSGKSGHHATLELEIKHGKGERVLPGAMQIQTQSDAATQLKALGFYFPDIHGPARPRVVRTETDDAALTHVSISLVPLTQKPGRQTLTLPPLPIAMARASGEVITLCTSQHEIEIVDPTANAPNAAPKSNPPPSRQREFWAALRNAVYGGALALLIAALVFWLVRWLQHRPKVLPPPPPPRPPWEIALETLRGIRAARLIEQQAYAEHFDRVSHALRLYLGGRFHFDGLESTTTEILQRLARIPEAHVVLHEVEEFLHQTDLVKFAHVTPDERQCTDLLERSERVVHETTPATRRAPVDSAPTDSAPTDSAPADSAPMSGGSDQAGDLSEGDERDVR
jgi:hypothetical protein